MSSVPNESVPPEVDSLPPPVALLIPPRLRPQLRPCGLIAPPRSKSSASPPILLVADNRLEISDKVLSLSAEGAIEGSLGRKPQDSVIPMTASPEGATGKVPRLQRFDVFGIPIPRLNGLRTGAPSGLLSEVSAKESMHPTRLSVIFLRDLTGRGGLAYPFSARAASFAK